MYNCCFCQKNQGQYEQGNGEYACFDCAIGQSRYIDYLGVDHSPDSQGDICVINKEAIEELTECLGSYVYEMTYVEKESICECGAHKVSSSKHSNWCPLS